MVREVLDLDNTNGNDLWWEVIKKEMKAVRTAFKILVNEEKPPPAPQFMKCHMAFDIKMEDFRRKVRLVAGGHMTEILKTLTYASVVSNRKRTKRTLSKAPCCCFENVPNTALTVV